jgi:hypothetical protein
VARLVVDTLFDEYLMPTRPVAMENDSSLRTIGSRLLPLSNRTLSV